MGSEVYAVLFRVLMFFVGAILGSFLCCQARRLHERESRGRKLGKRSECLSCGHHLKWYENLPIVSWIFLRGRCRKCGAKIGAAEILAEVGVGVMFLLFSFTVEVSSSAGWGWAEFLLLLVFGAGLGFLAVYDGLYGELPSAVLTFSVICATILVILKQRSLFLGGFSWEGILTAIGSGAVLAAPYLILYLVSRGKWVGDGDWILGLAIGLVLSEPFLSLFALFLTNLAASVVMGPLVRGRKSRQIHMGPFMVVGFVVTYMLAGNLMGLLS